VSGYPDNPSRGLPYISGVIVVNDAGTGVPLAVLDAAEITAARTAAASGLCVSAFAPAGWRNAAILGAGEQGRYHAHVLRTLNPACEIRAYDPVAERAASLNTGSVAALSPREAIDGADVVITAGPIVALPAPVVDSTWLPDKLLLLPLDFDSYVGADAVASCGVFLVDDIDQFEYHRALGHFSGWPTPQQSVGDALGKMTSDRVICTNLGIGALDAAFAHFVLEQHDRTSST